MFSGTGMRVTYDPDYSRASTHQIETLLKGLGYQRTHCVHDEEAGVVEVSAIKHYYVALEDNEHEVQAIRRVVG